MYPPGPECTGLGGSGGASEGHTHQTERRGQPKGTTALPLFQGLRQSECLLLSHETASIFLNMGEICILFFCTCMGSQDYHFKLSHTSYMLCMVVLLWITTLVFIH